jgi:hypothetical protein
MRANYELDVRLRSPVISVLRLILHRVGDALVPVACGRYLAEHIPGARFVEVPGMDHPYSTSRRRTSSPTIMVGHRPAPAPEPDRVLATVMFSDIVGSTQRGGDRRFQMALRDNWYSLMHKELIARGTDRHCRRRAVRYIRRPSARGPLCSFDP